MVFGDRLKELREEKGVTQKILGKVTNVSDRVIGYYETSNRFPKDEQILKALADYFDVSVDYLIGRTNLRAPENNSYELCGSCYYIRIEGLPPEAIKSIEDYVQLIRLKYENTRKSKRI